MYWVLVSSRHIMLVHLLQWAANTLSCSIWAMAWKMLGGTETNPNREPNWEHLNEVSHKPVHEQYECKMIPSLTLNSIHWNAVWKSLSHWTSPDLSLSTYLWNFTKYLHSSEDSAAFQAKSSETSSVLHVSRIYFPHNWVLALVLRLRINDRVTI